MDRILQAIFAIGLLAFILVKRRFRKSRPGLPPGPKPLPVIGNLHQLAGTGPQWLQLQRWSAIHGPVTHLSVAGQPLVVLATHAAARDLLAGRGARYSDRPRLVAAVELATRHLHSAFRPYDDAYRLLRKLHAPLLAAAAADRYRPVQSLEARQLLVDLLGEYDGEYETGLDFALLVERMTGSIIYALIYGYRLKSGHDQPLRDAHVTQDNFSRMAKTGAYLVDLFPVLNYLPRALAPWKAEGDALYRLEADLHAANFRKGLANPGWNFSKQFGRSCEASGVSAFQAAWTVGDTSLAGLDTSAIALQWFVVACVAHGRRFVAKAQRDLDEVVGRGRLPTYEDRPWLTYIDAVVQETLRWRPVSPSEIPHATKQEDTYMGFRIPAGSIVLPTFWAITRDESLFGADPDSFVPERWLHGDKLKDLPLTGFGFGRRACPGRHIALNGLFIIVAQLLWAFEIEAVAGKEVDDTDCVDGVLVKPKHFEAVFRPRGQWVRDVLRTQQQDGEDDLVALLDRMAGDSSD
ncbi:putative cytochrome P450 [Hypoxylon cercidicola]|nr:putative cytochrome P450 [Hypoxylon cercidicola]